MQYLSLLVSMKPPLLMYRKAVPVRMETTQSPRECGLMKPFLMSNSPIAVTAVAATAERCFLLKSAGSTRTSPSAVAKEIA